VEALITAHERPESVLNHAAADVVGMFERDATVDQRVTAHAGTVIGPDKLLKPIGERGFGIVYMADQQAPEDSPKILEVGQFGAPTPGKDLVQLAVAQSLSAPFPADITILDKSQKGPAGV
jgi:hypothetical protein